MKKLYFIALLIGAATVLFAQTASDYFIPLCVGNQTVLRTEDNPGWEGRLTTYSIIRTDTIGGIAYQLKEGKEYTFRNPTVPHAFQYFWLRKDVNGEILVRAYGNDSDSLSNAVVLTTEGPMFPNSHLSLGYHVSYINGPNQTFTDSVISINATFGPFTNCIQSRETNDSGGVTKLIEDRYYAYGVGEVGEHRMFPVNQTHTANFASAFGTGCIPFVDTLTTQTLDTCFNHFFDYYLSNLQIDSVNKTITVTWVFQDSLVQNQFVQTYNYLTQGNHVLGLSIQCTRSFETFYKPVYIGSHPSGITGAVPDAIEAKVYPNPAPDQLNISLGGLQAELVRVYDAQGRLLSETPQPLQNRLDISRLATGVYIAEVKVQQALIRLRWVKL